MKSLEGGWQSKWWVGPLLASIVALVGLGYFMLPVWAGDAIIHLRIAELTSQGEWFQFNRGESVVATTSILWTLILSAAFYCTSAFAVAWFVKMLLVILWFSTVFLASHWVFKHTKSIWITWLVGALIALNPGLFQNSVNGMEAILLPLGFLLLLRLVFPFRGPADDRRSSSFQLTVLGLISFLVVMTRPEGLVFAALLSVFLLWLDAGDSRRHGLAIGLGALAGLTITLGIYRAVSDGWVPDSGAARMAAARRQSYHWGSVMFHPKLMELLIAYLPLLLGFLGALLLNRPPYCRKNPEQTFVGLLLLIMIFVYSFVLGAWHTSRYWIPFLPLQCGLTGVAIHWLWQHPKRTFVRILVTAGCLWMFGLYGVELYVRVKQGVGTPHSMVANAVTNRPENTKKLLTRLGLEEIDRPLRLAVTEVQKRYYINDDNTVNILSLDGRASKSFKQYLEHRTGLRRFDLFLEHEEPHFIELGQFEPEEAILGELARQAQGIPDGTRLQVKGFQFRVVGHSGGWVRYLGNASDIHAR